MIELILNNKFRLGQYLSRCTCKHGGMSRKENLSKPVRILAPGDSFVVTAWTDVSEESVPISMQREMVFACRSRFKSPRGGVGRVVRTEIDQSEMPLECALRVKSAEFWLKLGDPTQALMEIQNLPERMQKHPWPLKVHLAAFGAIREWTRVQA